MTRIFRFTRIASTMLAIAALFLPGAASAQGFQLVANTSVKADAVDKATAEKIFFKKVATLDGVTVTPVDQALTAPVRESFSKAVLGRSASAVAQFWQQQIFSGADLPPVTKNGDAAVLEFVKSTPGAVGYVSAGASTAGAKVLTVK